MMLSLRVLNRLLINRDLQSGPNYTSPRARIPHSITTSIDAQHLIEWWSAPGGATSRRNASDQRNGKTHRQRARRVGIELAASEYAGGH
jgi:hypothetical protein